MGHITNEFTCVEFQIDMDYSKPYDVAEAEWKEKLAKLKAVVDGSEFSNFFNLVVGSNNHIFFTAAPSGSKQGWETSDKHAAEVRAIVQVIESVADFSIINKTTTSDG